MKHQYHFLVVDDNFESFNQTEKQLRAAWKEKDVTATHICSEHSLEVALRDKKITPQSIDVAIVDVMVSWLCPNGEEIEEIPQPREVSADYFTAGVRMAKKLIMLQVPCLMYTVLDGFEPKGISVPLVEKNYDTNELIDQVTLLLNSVHN